MQATLHGMIGEWLGNGWRMDWPLFIESWVNDWRMAWPLCKYYSFTIENRRSPHRHPPVYRWRTRWHRWSSLQKFISIGGLISETLVNDITTLQQCQVNYLIFCESCSPFMNIRMRGPPIDIHQLALACQMMPMEFTQAIFKQLGSLLKPLIMI